MSTLSESCSGTMAFTPATAATALTTARLKWSFRALRSIDSYRIVSTGPERKNEKVRWMLLTPIQAIRSSGGAGHDEPLCRVSNRWLASTPHGRKRNHIGTKEPALG